MTYVSGTAINLASQPFRRERAQNAMYAAGCAALVISLLVLTGLILHQRSQAASIRKETAAANMQLGRLQQEQRQFAAILGKPENEDVFSKSVFLNEVIARRAVSWTKVFADLETVLPSNMRVEVIRLPQIPAQEIGGRNRVQLDMVLGTDQPAAVIDFLKKLENSPLFGPAVVMNQSPPSQNDPLYKYRITVQYAQKL